MKEAEQVRRSSQQQGRLSGVHLTLLLSTLLLTTSLHATTQLLLARGTDLPSAEVRGVVELTVNPGFDGAKVTVLVDGQPIAQNIGAPYRVTMDFGPNALQHRISVTATSGKKRVQWHETLNRGLLPLSVKLRQVAGTTFEAEATAPKEDPIEAVELWEQGVLVEKVAEAPYRFTVTPEQLASGFLQVTARAKSGEEAADFWSSAGDVHVESIQVRTVPIFVSVVDRNGVTQDNVDRSLFRILDNDNEGHIVEFGKAFDQPIAISLLLDSSASMTYMMPDVTKAAQEFANRTLKNGDKCSVIAIQDVPRRKQSLTDDRDAVKKALGGIQPHGETALYDAIETAIRELRDEKTRRAIVVLTDGSDNASMASWDEMQKAAQQAGIPVYFIAYDTGDVNQRDVDRLKFLASETGGFVAVAMQQNLLAKFGEIEKDLRAQFAITYQVTDYAKPNQWRPIRVTLASPKLTARTIRGYFAP